MAAHGTPGRYHQHITDDDPPCPPCREAARLAKERWRRRRYLNRGPLLVDATGTRRRLRALAAIGWPNAAIGALAGADHSTVSAWSNNARVRAGTADTVRRVYDELSMTPGPSAKVRQIAARKGWAPPLAWDDDSIDDPAARPSTGAWAARRAAPMDEIAVQRAMRGHRVHLTPSERAEAVRRLTAQGRSAAEIAGRLGVAQRSVVRHRAADRTEVA